MQELSGRWRARALCTCTAMAATAALAQQSEAARLATLRAVGPHYSNQMIRLLANRAEPVTLNNAQFPNEASTTPEQIIRRLCGTLRPAYVEEAARANGLATLPLNVPLGEKARTFLWPACLFVQQAGPAKSIEVKPGDTAHDLYKAYTGGGGNDETVARFFGLPIESLRVIKPGTRLEPAALTVTVPIVARSGTGAELVEELRRLDPRGRMVNEAPAVDGSIVMGGAAEGTTAAGPDCVGSIVPFRGLEVFNAYDFAKRTARSDDVNVAWGRVEMAVVDNGFFGARARDDGGNPFTGSPFPRAFFKDDPDHTIATALVLGETLKPINYALGIAPTTESGHGTHVTGLLLGGPEFSPYLSRLRDDPWASVTVLNVGRGLRTLYKGAYGLLMSRLQADSAARIVNLSIAHDGRVDRQVGPAYGSLFRMANNTLFVAAAGNNWEQEVGERGIFPAAHGGPRRGNVITVAAVDAADRLAAFSNRSGRSVDMGAPGCRISSWIAHDQPPVAMSGTSQAAPLVSFGAALLRSIAAKATASTLKDRLVASGDLLPESERGKTAFEVKLDIPRALLWFHDVLEVREGGARRRLPGRLRNVAALKCQDGARQVDKGLEDLYALKRREDGPAYYFGGRVAGQVEAPCKVIAEADAGIYFDATHEVDGNGNVEPLRDTTRAGWLLSEVRDLTVRTPLAELR